MELSVIASAIRRYFWLPIVLAALGALPGLLQGRNATTEYESRAVMLLSPLDRVRNEDVDADRYIAGQVSVLASDLVASRAVESIDASMSPTQALRAMSFPHNSGSDVVVVVARTESPTTSPQLANAFANSYLDYLQEALDRANQPERERLSSLVATLQEQLNMIDAELQEVIAPYLSPDPDPGALGFPPIPTLEQLAPSLVSQRAVLLAELQQARGEQAAFNATVRTTISSALVQPAESLPIPIESSSKRLVALGVLAGGFVGVLASVLLARVSPRVVDATELEDLLGHPLVGEAPPIRKPPRVLTSNLPVDLVPFISELCVRIEANERSAGPIVVVLAGTQREAGTSTLSVAVASWFASGGLRVRLVDADRRDPDITNAFGTAPVEDDEPIPSGPNARRRERAPRHRWLTPPVKTSIPQLMVSSLLDPLAVRRASTSDLLAGAGPDVDVLVVDAGPILATATAVHLTRAADTVVLCVPRRQSARSLAEIAREFRDRPVLVVWTPTRSHLFRPVSTRPPVDREPAPPDVGPDTPGLPSG